MHVFCAVLAWSLFRFVRFAADEKAATTLGLLAGCFEVLGGVPKTVLADRMGFLKADVVANVVVPAAGYVRFATHWGFRPDFCEAADPESKGDRGAPGGYAKRDLIVPAQPDVTDLSAANQAAAAWCAEVNVVVHSEICVVPAGRLEAERALLGPLPSLRPEIGPRSASRKVDKLSCVRFGSVRYSAHRRHRADRRAPDRDPDPRAIHRGGRRRAPARPAQETSIHTTHITSRRYDCVAIPLPDTARAAISVAIDRSLYDRVEWRIPRFVLRNIGVRLVLVKQSLE